MERWERYLLEVVSSDDRDDTVFIAGTTIYELSTKAVRHLSVTSAISISCGRTTPMQTLVTR